MKRSVWIPLVAAAAAVAATVAAICLKKKKCTPPAVEEETFEIFAEDVCAEPCEGLCEQENASTEE